MYGWREALFKFNVMLRNTKQWLYCLELWTSRPGVKYVLKLFSLGFSTLTKQRQLLMYRGRSTQPRGFASDEIIDLYTRWVFASCILHCLYIRFIHYLSQFNKSTWNVKLIYLIFIPLWCFSDFPRQFYASWSTCSWGSLLICGGRV